MKSPRRLIRNRVTEKDVRDYLSQHGYEGDSATFQELELVAIQRPGWIQIFRFAVRVVDEHDQWHDLVGAVHDDERRTTRVFATKDADEQIRVIGEWSEGLITLRRDRSALTPILLGVFAIALGAAIVAAILNAS